MTLQPNYTPGSLAAPVLAGAAAVLALTALRWLISPLLVARRHAKTGARPYVDAAASLMGEFHEGVNRSTSAVGHSAAQSTSPPCSLLRPASKTLSVIVPAYNEVQRLPHMLNETLAYLARRAGSDSSSREFTYEVIVVDDGSTDGTSQVGRHPLLLMHRCIRHYLSVAVQQQARVQRAC